MEEVKQKKELEFKKANERCFETTTGNDYVHIDLNSIQVGAKVMRTKDNIPIPYDHRDKQFLVETKMAAR